MIPFGQMIVRVEASADGVSAVQSRRMAPSTLRPPVLDTFQAVVAEFSEFLTVAIHTILYERDIYPRTSFLSARKYNYSVRQNRHPEVCKWIQDAVAAVEVEMLKVYIFFFTVAAPLLLCCAFGLLSVA